MTKRLFDQPQPAALPILGYQQLQQWPNQQQHQHQQQQHNQDSNDQQADPADDQDDESEANEELADEETTAEPQPQPDAPDALKAERRKNNQLEREIRNLKRKLSEFSRINPEEYERLKQEEHHKEELERQLAHREQQLEASAARKVKAVAKERDEALSSIQDLRKERLLERLFYDADGRTGGDNRGSFFEIFKQQVGSEFRLSKDPSGRDYLETIDSKGSVLLGDQGNLDPAEHIETLRTHPVLSFLFNQRGGLGPNTMIAEFDGNGQMTNLNKLSASELYVAHYSKRPAGARR